ncbi:hypothetical protein [Acinetobacter pittii]|uniref:hypothetical protein n=1 Tax=Acinetobacter pittii TaxID=48296 RepID=UPI002DB7E29F|nr:hypothetical protein [Acinetobacter pittii]MEB6672464.1 hypothetical protein [Acinetobacter pittii]
MDNTLKAAYAALEKWKKNVTVKDFVRDNKRLNSSANPHSPTLTEFMQLSTVVETQRAYITRTEEKSDLYQLYVNLFSYSHKSELDYFIDNKKVLEQIIALNKENNWRSVSSKTISKDVISILVERRNEKILLTRSQDTPTNLDTVKNIRRLLAVDEKPIPRTRPHNSSADEILESYVSHQSCIAY